MVTHGSSAELYEGENRLRDEIEKRTGRSPEELFEEREKRVNDALQLREPDRVPVLLGMNYFPAKYTGVPASAAFYDAAAWKAANRKTIVDFEPDLWRASSGTSSGLVLELLDAKQSRWPGYNLPPDVSHQFVEAEYMKEDEYDLFLSDPSDFILRYYLPRVFGTLEPLGSLPPLRNLSGTSFTAVTSLLATRQFQRIAEALGKAGEAEAKWRKEMSTFQEEMARLGFPPHHHGGGVGLAPFDAISDNFRGMRGAMIDMYRRPVKLLAACDKILEWRMQQAVPADPAKRGNPKRVHMPLHRGAEGFMSRQQFEKFYWPGLKKAIRATIDLGFFPMPFFEGKFDSRLEYLLELPRGSVACLFEHTDMARAKAILGDQLCIVGNVPSPMLQVGSVSEVEEYCRNLIKTCGKGGGFILSNASNTDYAKPENIKAMIDSVKKYG